MGKMNLWTVWITLCIILFEQNYAAARKCEKSCRTMQSHGMQSADCYDKDLKIFPCLPSNIEVIDLSFNRIRELTRDDLRDHSLKILYLSDNMIMRIDEDTFTDQDDLQVLDLTMNSFTTLPAVIFQLPSLRRLYLGQNANANIAEIIERVPAIESPLQHLDVSHNRLERLPALGVLPTLLTYNVSGNREVTVAGSHFAGLCNLKRFSNENVTLRFADVCECWRVERWLERREVEFETFECATYGNEDECEIDIPLADTDVFDRCRQQHNEMLQKAKIMNTVLPIVAAVVILFLAVIAYLIMRRRKRRAVKKPWKVDIEDDDTKDTLY